VEALSSALFTVMESTPFSNFAETLLVSTGRGSQTVLVNDTFLVNGRSVEIWVAESSTLVTFVASWAKLTSEHQDCTITYWQSYQEEGL